MIILFNIVKDEYDFQVVIEEIKNEFAQYDPALLIGVGLLLFIILLILSCKKVIFSDKKLQEAK